MHVNTCWTQPLGLADSLEILRSLALEHARESGPYADQIFPLIENRRWVELIAYELDYNIGASPLHVLNARQALGFFQKLEPLDIGVDKEEVAFIKFERSERLCAATNELFRALRLGRASVPSHVWQILLSARRKIRGVLGLPPSLDQIKMRFGPGATTSIRKIDANPVTKMAAGFACSTDVLASGLLPSVLREVPHWTASIEGNSWSIDDEGFLVETVPVEITPGHLAFVPKNAKTYRSIVVEPVLNGFVQAGLGDVIARRLLRVGVDVRDQTANQRSALEGSLDGSLATIDLSSASDLISTEVVRFLLPDDWFRLLASFRTSEVEYKGSSIFLQKFSSMGNGFTFPLETLIFYALTQAACHDPRVLAYGDDIICPSELAPLVMETLRYCGFEVNSEKSYASGPFRESCGKDYYLGINVRPFYQKTLVSGRSLFVLHNYYVRSGSTERAQAVRQFIPRSLRIYGPEGYGDGHLVSETYPRTYKKRDVERGYCGFYFETYRATPRKFRNIYPGDWASPLYSVYTRGEVPLIHPDIPVNDYVSAVDSSTFRARWSLPGDDGYSRTLIYSLAC